MTYWTLVPDASERDVKPIKIITQLKKPGSNTARVKGYLWIHGFEYKKDVIKHLNKLGIANKMRPFGFKTYDGVVKMEKKLKQRLLNKEKRLISELEEVRRQIEDLESYFEKKISS